MLCSGFLHYRIVRTVGMIILIQELDHQSTVIGIYNNPIKINIVNRHRFFH
ncbi:MAG: hypothetical protein ACI9MU_004023 [Alphaproteobacteria bacterium]